MGVDTLSAIEQAMRTQLLTYVPSSGGTLSSRLGTATGAGSSGKLYIDQPPDSVTEPYGVMRFIEFPVTGLDGGAMVKGTLELIIYGRPRAQGSTIKAMGALVLEAWKNFRYTESSGRCLVARDATSMALVPYTDPADRELVACRLLLPFMVTPTFVAA